MMGVVKMMAVASMEVAAASVGESVIVAAIRHLDENQRIGGDQDQDLEETRALAAQATAALSKESLDNIWEFEPETDGVKEEVEDGEYNGAVNSDERQAIIFTHESCREEEKLVEVLEVAGEMASLNEVTEAGESTFVVEAPPVEAENEAQNGTGNLLEGPATISAHESGEENLVDELKVAGEIAALNDVMEAGESTSMLEAPPTEVEAEVDCGAVVPGEVVAATSVHEPGKKNPAEVLEVAGEIVALNKVTAAAECTSKEVEAEVQSGAGNPADRTITITAHEAGGEILTEVLQVTAELAETSPEPVTALVKTEGTPAAEVSSEESGCHSQEVVAGEGAGAPTEVTDSAVVRDTEQAEDSAPSGEKASQEEVLPATTKVAMVEEPLDLEAKHSGTLVTIPALAVTLRPSILHNLQLQTTVSSDAEEKSMSVPCHPEEMAPETGSISEPAPPSEATAAPPAGLEDQAVEKAAAAEEESAMEPKALTEQHNMASLMDIQQSQIEEIELGSVLDETEDCSVLDKTEDCVQTATKPPEATALTCQEIKEQVDIDSTVKTGCQLM